MHGDSCGECRGQLLVGAHISGQGAEAYARLEESFPDSWRTHQLRAEGYALRRDLDDAIKEFKAALQLRPNEPELHEALGELYLDTSVCTMTRAQS